MASCDRVGVQDVMNGFDAYSSYPYFALFQAKEIKFTFTDDDPDRGRKLLEDNLNVLHRNGSIALFTLRFYNNLDKNGAIKDVTPYSGSFSFKVTTPVTFELAKNAAAGQDNSQFLTFLIAERDQLKMQLAELQEENDELKDLLAEADDNDNGQPKKDLGFIGLIGEAGNQFPWMQEMIKDGFTLLKHKFAKPQHHTQHAGAMAGIQTDPNARPDEQVNNAIKHIITFYTNKYGQEEGWKLCAIHLTKLAELTEDEDIYALAIKKLMAL